MPESATLRSPRKSPPKTSGAEFLAGGGEMGRRMRALDWTHTPLGPPERWPTGLKTAARILLTSRKPMFIAWGERYALLYNDACKAVVGGKHPRVLGQSAPAAWGEVWALIGARAAKAMHDNEGLYDKCIALNVERDGHDEQTTWSIVYSPLPGDQGGPGGVFCSFSQAETLHEVALALSSELDLQALVQKVTDAGTRLTRARFGAFFYNTVNAEGQAYQLYTLSGAPRAAFEKLGLPRATPIFEPTFLGEGIVRLDDVTKDPRYGTMAPHHGMPKGHLPVRSYLAVPVISRTREVLGGLFFGHPEPGIFDERSERNAQVIAAQAAVAIDNSHLFAMAREEIEERSRVQVALGESEARYRDLVQGLPAAVYTTDRDGHIQLYNEAAVALWGRVPQPGDFWCGSYRIHHPDGALMPPDACPMARVLKGERVEGSPEIVIERPDGTRRHALANPRALLDAEGSITGAINMLVDITERKAAEAELLRSREELRELDRRKNEFLATLAHELRNPLAPLRNGLEIMRLGRGNAGMVEQARTMMERQLHQMVRLVDDLLDVSRVSRGMIELHRERIDLATVIHNAVETSRPLIDHGGHELSLEIPPEPIVLDADVTRLSQAFANLLNNAAKYTDRGGRIRLAVAREGQFAAVTVKDNGIGIPAHMIDRVFGIFTQVERSLERTQGGLGIGLSIAQRLVEMHGGTISARSAGPGQGSEFTVRLPVAAAQSVPAPDNARASVAAAPQKRRVLVADDNVDSASSLSLVLQVMGNDVRVAHDGIEALSVASTYRPDVVLLDIGMPGMNGYDVCRRIREKAWGRSLLIVALTGWGQEGDKQRSRDSGFDHHLVKPVEPHTLESLLANWRAESDAIPA